MVTKDTPCLTLNTFPDIVKIKFVLLPPRIGIRSERSLVSTYPELANKMYFLKLLLGMYLLSDK